MQVFLLIGVALVMSVALLTGSPTQAAVPADCQNVATGQGPVNGVVDADHGLCVYKGIPYAAPPVKQLRFQKARPHDPWTEPLQADDFDEGCPRYPIAFPPKLQPDGDEDCLTLNIWHQNKGDAPKPVMVWYYGGGFILGSADQDMYESSQLALHGDVIVVTTNYRLGFFGYLNHPALRAQDGQAGNYGTLDQIAALKWVHDNIAAFGGDPGNVTIFGESAGAISVDSVMMAPQAKGLFHKAINESGPSYMFSWRREQYEQLALEMAGKLDCADAASARECLRALPVEKVMEKIPWGLDVLLPKKDGTQSYPFGPVTDGVVGLDHPHKVYGAGTYPKDVPVLIGSNSDEYALVLWLSGRLEDDDAVNAFTESRMADIERLLELNVDVEKMYGMYPAQNYDSLEDRLVAMVTDMAFACGARMHANNLAKNGTPVYHYLFSKPPGQVEPFKSLGAFHAAELLFVFGNLNFFGINMRSDSNLAMSEKIMDLWTSFARTGTPASDKTPAWPKYDPTAPKMMHLDDEPVVEDVPKLPACDYLKDLIEQRLQRAGKSSAMAQ